MSLEQAIIELVVAGAPQFDAANEKIQVDLTSTERAGKRAEAASTAASTAARQAEQSARALQVEVVKSLHILHSAVSLADRLAVAAGVDPTSTTGQALELGRDIVGGAATGAKLGSVIAPGAGTLLGTILGATIGLAEGVTNINKKLDSQAAKGSGASGSQEISDALVRESALAKLDHAAGGGGRQVQ